MYFWSSAWYSSAVLAGIGSCNRLRRNFPRFAVSSVPDRVRDGISVSRATGRKYCVSPTLTLHCSISNLNSLCRRSYACAECVRRWVEVGEDDEVGEPGRVVWFPTSVTTMVRIRPPSLSATHPMVGVEMCAFYGRGARQNTVKCSGKCYIEFLHRLVRKMRMLPRLVQVFVFA